MKTTLQHLLVGTLSGLALSLALPARTEIADLADVPLANSPSDAVLPNLMYILDDSGSMQWDYMPDNIQRLTSGSDVNNCKICSTTSCTIAGEQCAVGNQGSTDNNTADFADPPYYAAQFNQIYYNPDITYSPAVDSTGTSYGNIPPTAAYRDFYTNWTTVNLVSQYPEVWYCRPSGLANFQGYISTSGGVTRLTVTSLSSGTMAVGQLIGANRSVRIGVRISALGSGSGGTGTYVLNQWHPDYGSSGSPRTFAAATSAQLADTALCKRNGRQNVQAAPNDYFMYWSNNQTAGTPMGAYPVQNGTTTGSFNLQFADRAGAAHYYTITPEEHCRDRNLVECTLSSAPTGLFTVPAPIRYCNSTANASSAAAVSDPTGTASPRCRQKYSSTYQYPRYGRFRRTDIVPTTPTYTKSATSRRTDCAAAASCTYAEELQNFANWYSYYRTRMSMMKTATGRAFLPIDDRYRVGFITINPGSPVVRSESPSYDGRYLPIAQFSSGHKANWYATLYQTGSNGSTPLRQALSRVGRHYAGVTSDINNGMTEDPVQYSCQQNFALLTTDGYYNDSTSDTWQITNARVGNQDNTPTSGTPTYVSRPTGTLDATGSVITSTPTETLSQVVCTGNNTTAFPGGGSNTACGCTGSNRRIKQRTQIGSTDSTTVDGVATTTGSTISSTTFQNITACTAPFIQTTVIRVTETEQRVCNRNNATNFSAGGSANDPGEINCSCGSSPTRYSRYERVITYDRTIVTTDGTVTSNTTGNWITRQFNLLGTACVGSAPAITLTPNPTATNGATTVTDNGGTTLAVTLTPNPQTTVTGAATENFSSAGTANTLADVAMYYYRTDLRTSGSANITQNNVPTNSKDVAPHQHMVTFTLGLGLQGLMDYTADYESNPSGDFANIKAGTFGACPWMDAGEQCNWPIPAAGGATALDDLWHAAVNGRGVYYSASDPNSLADGLSNALSSLQIQTASASASATSSPNITQTDNYIYSSTFRTVKWDGQIDAKRLDPVTGAVLPTIQWSAQGLLDAKTTTNSDTRVIWKLDPSGTNNLRAFTFANLTSAAVGTIDPERPYFTNKCNDLSQCALLTAAQQTIANDGTAMVNYLRGQTGNEGTIFRDREHVLGDSVNATPAFVRAPRLSFTDAVTPSYDTFKTANAGRQAVLYVAANDGMLHAFNGDTGEELWAYVPRIVMPNLHKLAADNWTVGHKYSVDGSPVTMDVFDSTAGAWKTILVAGLNKGGRGYYALDITNPSAPRGMWETCSDQRLCANYDDDIGFTFGQPVVTKLPDVAALGVNRGRWVVLVTSGINNVSPGTGRGYLYVLDAFDGAIISKTEATMGTPVGDTTTPSGFARISAWANAFSVNNTATHVYGGDLLGNVWRFDLATDPPTVQKLGELRDAGGRPQSITAKPELGLIDGNRVLFIGTGRYLGANDLPDGQTLIPALNWAYQQSIYAFKDRGSDYGNIRTAANMVTQTVTDAGTTRTGGSANVNWASHDGWLLDLNAGNTSPGERVNLDPQLVRGTLVVLTNVPNDSACSVGGDGYVYQLDYRTGRAVSSSPGGVIATKYTGSILVGVVIVTTSTGAIKAELTTSRGDQPTLGINTGGGGGGARRVSWRELIQ